MQTTKPIVATAAAWADAIGCDRKTLLAKLGELGVKPGPHEKIEAKSVFEAMHGDYRAERTLLTRAQRQKAELELGLRRGQLVEAERVLSARNAADAVLFSVWEGRLSETCAKLSGLPADAQEAHWRKVVSEIKELARTRYEELMNA